MDPISTGVVSGLIVLAKVWDKITAKKHSKILARMERNIDKVLVNHEERITRQEHLTTGIDGQNGMRGDVQELKRDMDTLKRRGFLTNSGETPIMKIN